MNRYFHWYLLLTMELMNHLEELRQTKLITEKWIITVREQEAEEGGERQSEELQNEWTSENILVILSSAPLPHCFSASLPRLCWAQIQFSVQITSSASQKKASGVRRSHPPPPCLNPLLARREADGASRMALDCTCTGGFPALLPSFHTHNPQTITLFPFLWVSIRWPTNSPRGCNLQ